MKFKSYELLGQTADQTISGTGFDCSQVFKISAQVTVASGVATGSMQLEVSNDPVNVNNVTPVWSALGSPVTITTSGTTLIAQQDLCYNSIRAKYTSTFLNIATIVAVADVAGSLNSKYFIASSTTGNYYFWFDNGSGVDPAVTGRTGVKVTYTDGDTAATLGGLIRTAAAAKGWTVTGATTTAILTNTVVGRSTAAANGTPSPGFTITNSQPSAAISVKAFTLGV